MITDERKQVERKELAPSFPGAVARIEEALAERAAEQQRLRRERIEQVEAVAREARSRVQELFGAERYSRWRAFLRERRDARRSRALPPIDAAALEARLERQAASDRAAALRMLQEEWKVSPEAILAVHSDASHRISELFPFAQQTDPNGPVIRAPGPSFGLTHGEAGIFVNTITPPYAGTASSSSWSDTGPFDLATTPFADKDSGLVGQNLDVSIENAGDPDIAMAEDHRQISALYLMPHAGRVTVLITMVIEKAIHHVTLEDEWGLSLADVVQENTLTLTTTGSDGQPTAAGGAVISRYRKGKNTTGQWIVPAQPAGATFVVAHASSQSYAEDEIVRLDVGSLSRNQVYADDMEVRSSMAFRYRVERLVVTVLP